MELKSNQKIYSALILVFWIYVFLNLIEMIANGLALYASINNWHFEVMHSTKKMLIIIPKVAYIVHTLFNLIGLVLLVILFYRFSTTIQAIQSEKRIRKVWAVIFWVFPIIADWLQYLFFKRYIATISGVTHTDSIKINRLNNSSLTLFLSMSIGGWIISGINHFNEKIIDTKSGLSLTVVTGLFALIFSILRLGMFKWLRVNEAHFLNMYEHGATIEESDQLDSISNI